MAHVARGLDPIVASNAVCYFLEISFKEIKALEAGTPSRSLLEIYEDCATNLQGAQKMYDLHKEDLSLQGRLEFWDQYRDLEKRRNCLKERINFATRAYATAPLPAMLPARGERKA